MVNNRAYPQNGHPEQRTHWQKNSSELRNFIRKCNNDRIMSSAAGLAYNLILSLVPIAVALISVLGFILGSLNVGSQAQLIEYIQPILPSILPSKDVLQVAMTSLNRHAGLLGLTALLAAIFGGSRLFVAIESYFAIIYRTAPRKLLAQNILAFLMLLIYIVLTPLMILASSVPALLLEFAENSRLSKLPGVPQLTQNSLLLDIATILGSLLVSWILFVAIYLVIPHLKISLKRSWLGAVVAATLLELFLFLFPLYITHFMTSYTGSAGFAVIFLLFFYYFAIILLLGAEINAYFAEGIQPLPNNMATVICEACGQPQKGPAAPSPSNGPGRVADN